MTTAFRIERIGVASPAIDAAARLHIECLSDTLTSNRGAPVVAEIYRRLIHEGHSLYLAFDGGSVVGGLMVMLHGRRRATSFTVSHRPWSWMSVVRRLGVGATLRQVRDLIQVTHRTGWLAPHDYIVALYVDNRVRRSGVARSLLTRAAADSTLRGVGMGVDTLLDNHSARRLYLSFGFREEVSTSRSQVFTWISG